MTKARGRANPREALQLVASVDFLAQLDRASGPLSKLIIGDLGASSMYDMFANMHNVVKTETNSRIFLDDPALKDGKLNRYVSYISYGTMEVFTQPEIQSQLEGVGSLHMLPWYIENMQGEGNSSIGSIKVVGSPELMTTGVVREHVPGQMFPAILEASVFQVFDIPTYGRLHNKAQVMISAIVDTVPPFDALCKCTAALLYDDDNRVRGMVDGRALTILPLD